jgi:hypothetical protein
LIDGSTYFSTVAEAFEPIWVSPPPALVDLSLFHTPFTRIASDHLPLKAIIRTPNAEMLG